MEQSNFYEAKSFLYEFYGIDMEDETFETIGLHAWEKINNKAYRFYTFSGQVKDCQITLPCNADIIEYVQAQGEAVGTTDSVSNLATYQRSSQIEEAIENLKYDRSEFYGRGHYVEYSRSGSTLFFTRDDFQVNILYKGIVLDEEGLPMLNVKEIEAIAKYCAYVDLQKKAMITKDRSTMELAMMMRQDWGRACADARTPVYFTQNDMNKVLQVQASWDRTKYGVNFKILR